MKKLFIFIFLLIPLIIYSAPKRRYVIVKKGETLYRIAKRHKTTVATLIKINKIKDVSKIHVGKRIYLPYYRKTVKKRIPKSKKKYTKLNIKLVQPVKGKILNNFNEGKDLVQCNGIEYITKKGEKVKSALSGTVKYTGSLKGYGNIVIIEHSRKIATVYAYLNNIKVRTGQKVKKRDLIGTAGLDNSKKKYVLHFELLRNGRPINPKYYF